MAPFGWFAHLLYFVIQVLKFDSFCPLFLDPILSTKHLMTRSILIALDGILDIKSIHSKTIGNF